ncbi:MAG: electron transfer flavoprotein subunit beta/FixA family protein, partial [Burkholderiales bacterium]
MKIAVLVKSVPETTDVLYDVPGRRIVRENIGGTLNPDDIAAVEIALQLKDKYGAEVRLFTLAPPLAEDMLRELLAMGADAATHIQGDEFRASDGLVTATVLAKALTRDPTDLILTGLRAADGGGGQIGPRVAEILARPCVTYATTVGDVKDGKITVEKKFGDHVYSLEVPLPAVITVQRHLAKARLASVQGILEAAMKQIEVVDAAGLGIDPSAVGASGSALRLRAAEKAEMKRTPEVFGGDLPAACDGLWERLIS